MLMRKGGVIIDVPENGIAFYIRAGYIKVEEVPVVEVAPVEPEPKSVVVETPKKKKAVKR